MIEGGRISVVKQDALSTPFNLDDHHPSNFLPDAP